MRHGESLEKALSLWFGVVEDVTKVFRVFVMRPKDFVVLGFQGFGLSARGELRLVRFGPCT